MVTFGGFYEGRRVFLTGHTGFKGSWLTQWLLSLGAEVTGYSLEPPTRPSLFDAAGLGDTPRGLVDLRGDVRDACALTAALREAAPEVVFHLAAQPLVRQSFAEPRLTYETNVMGTVNLLEGVRALADDGGPLAVVNVTSDKCYDNVETGHAYVEGDPLGGFDPYSSSKACSELVTSAYARSFFPETGQVRVASARAGNVIGGGDWAADRVLADCARALNEGADVVIRNPEAVRPWQHVLESLSGYLALGAALWRGDGVVGKAVGRGSHAWNFGPASASHVTVREMVELFIGAWGEGTWTTSAGRGQGPHEAGLLRLNSEKSRATLGWRPVWSVAEAVAASAGWYRRYYEGADVTTMLALCRADTAAYGDAARRAGSEWAIAKAST